MVLTNACVATYNLTNLVNRPISEGIDDSSLFSAKFLFSRDGDDQWSRERDLLLQFSQY
jgi:hypothetical protein